MSPDTYCLFHLSLCLYEFVWFDVKEHTPKAVDHFHVKPALFIELRLTQQTDFAARWYFWFSANDFYWRCSPNPGLYLHCDRIDLFCSVISKTIRTITEKNYTWNRVPWVANRQQMNFTNISLFSFWSANWMGTATSNVCSSLPASSPLALVKLSCKKMAKAGGGSDVALTSSRQGSSLISTYRDIALEPVVRGIRRHSVILHML